MALSHWCGVFSTSEHTQDKMAAPGHAALAGSDVSG